MTSSPDPLPPPLRCGLFRAGHQVHFVQAIRAGNDGGAWPGNASVDAAGWISITLDSRREVLRWTHDPARLDELLGRFGGRVVLRTKSILSIPFGDGAHCVSVGDGPSACPAADEDLSDLSLGELLGRRGGVTLRLSD